MTAPRFDPVYVSPVEDWLCQIEEAIGREMDNDERRSVVTVLREIYASGRRDGAVAKACLPTTDTSRSHH